MMKIPNPVRVLYEASLPRAEALKKYCAARLEQRNSRWHYEARVKSLESFALKLETGRVKDAGAMEDFFACTIVVPSYKNISDAVTLIEEHFDVKDRRPNDESTTHKRPAVFDFDDLRLYVVPKQSTSWVVDPLIIGMRFEIQVKTFLQHAWAIATHDLVYKADSVSWPLERVSFQVKAMLEHAELVISEATKITDSGLLKKSDFATQRISKVIGILLEHWEVERLPTDIRRVASSVCALMDSLRLNVADLGKILELGIAKNGSHSLDASPYETLLKYLLQQHEDVVRDYVAKVPKKGCVYVLVVRPIEGFEDLFNNAKKYPGLVLAELPDG